MNVQIFGGAGWVGSTIAFAMMCRVVDDFSIHLVDSNIERLEGEFADLERANEILNLKIPITYSGEAGRADIHIICAGSRRALGESDQHLFVRNNNIVAKIMDDIRNRNHEKIRIIMVTNPAKRFAMIYDTEYIGEHCDSICPGNPIMKRKGYTNWGIAAELVEAL